MGFIKAFVGGIKDTFADQWQDYYMPSKDITSTTAFCQAVRVDGAQNTKGNSCVISNGSKIMVPEGMALVTMQDGAITGFVAEAGGFIWQSDDPNSQSIFAGDGVFKNLWQSTWDKVKFGGQITANQLAFYVKTTPVQGVRFGSSKTIYWNDTFLATKAGAGARGTYTLTISDPMLFAKNFVDPQYRMDGAAPFDFNDVDNDKANNLNEQFNSELTQNIAQFSTLAAQTNQDTVDYIQANTIAIAKALSEAVERDYTWTTVNGLTISNVAIDITYDEATQELLESIRKDDQEIRKARRMGAEYSNNMAGMMAASTAQAMNAAASNEGGAMVGIAGFNMMQNVGANMMGAATQAQAAQPMAAPAAPGMPAPVTPEAAPAEDPTEKLLNMKKLLDAGAITQEEYDKVKNQVLGI